MLLILCRRDWISAGSRGMGIIWTPVNVAEGIVTIPRITARHNRPPVVPRVFQAPGFKHEYKVRVWAFRLWEQLEICMGYTVTGQFHSCFGWWAWGIIRCWWRQTERPSRLYTLRLQSISRRRCSFHWTYTVMLGRAIFCTSLWDSMGEHR